MGCISIRQVFHSSALAADKSLKHEALSVASDVLTGLNRQRHCAGQICHATDTTGQQQSSLDQPRCPSYCRYTQIVNKMPKSYAKLSTRCQSV
jgi:hypothetical protein